MHCTASGKGLTAWCPCQSHIRTRMFHCSSHLPGHFNREEGQVEAGVETEYLRPELNYSSGSRGSSGSPHGENIVFFPVSCAHLFASDRLCPQSLNRRESNHVSHPTFPNCEDNLLLFENLCVTKPYWSALLLHLSKKATVDYVIASRSGRNTEHL